MFATIDAAEAAFYSAIERHDVNAMRDIWSNSDRAAYIEPNGNAAVGIEAIIETMAHAFASAPFVQFELTHLTQSEPGNSAAIRLVRENVTFVADNRKTALVGTNVFRRDATGWKILLHQATRLAT